MKLVSKKQYTKKIRKMSDDKLLRQIYTTNIYPSLHDYKLIAEEELLKRGIEIETNPLER